MWLKLSERRTQQATLTLAPIVAACIASPAVLRFYITAHIHPKIHSLRVLFTLLKSSKPLIISFVEGLSTPCIPTPTTAQLCKIALT
jgi:hypothetical protein